MNIWKAFKKLVKKVLGLEKKPQSFKYPYLVEYKKEKVQFEVNNHIERFRLKDFGGEEDFVRMLVGSLKRSDVFFDIGASVGLISVFAARKLKHPILPAGKVVSFEPDPENALRLRKNLEINRLKNCRVEQMAVSSEEGELTLYSDGSNANSPSLEQVNGIERGITVPAKTIDSLVESGILPYPTVVKIDIEGAEMLALQGMKALLGSGKRPRLIFVEIHPDFLPSFGTDSESIIQFIEGFGYNKSEAVERENQLLCTFSL